MASKYFKLFNFGKKVGPTIQGVAPKVAKTTREKINRTMGQIKRMTTAKTKKLTDDMQMKSKEITDTLNKMRTPKAEGGSMNDKSSAVDKAILKGVSQGVFSIDDFKKYKKTGEIPGSKRTEKAIGGMLGFKKKDKKKEKEKEDSKKGTKPKDLIYKPKKMKRLEELRKELKKDGGPIGAAGQGGLPRKPQYITKKEKPKYITRKEKPKYITKKSKFITKKKKPVQSESKYITRKEKPKYITRKEKVATPGRVLGGGPRD
jgi:uncharacterized protein YoxC